MLNLPFTIYYLPKNSHFSYLIDKTNAKNYSTLKIENLPAGRQGCELIIEATEGSA